MGSGLDLSEDGDDERPKCADCLLGCRKVTTFFLSHVGLVSLVVGYCIMGAFTFEALERENEIQVKRNMTNVREEVTKYLWKMTESTTVIHPEKWVQNATDRLAEFERELLQAMKKGGWDGSESELTQQWTFSGALFYSIVVITTIGYGHVTPKTVWGKVVTIFYAILGIPLMLLCLSHIGDFMAKAFRFLYWRVCCYVCTRKPRATRRHPVGTFRRGRSLRVSSSRNPTVGAVGGSRGTKRSASATRRSARASQRSADSAYSDSAIFLTTDPVCRRVHSDENISSFPIHESRGRSPPPPHHLRLDTYPNANARILLQPFVEFIRRSSRSAEPMFDSHPRNLSILCNKYAEDIIVDESQMIRGPQVRVSRIRPPPEQFAYSDYWEEDVDDYIHGSEDEVKNRPVPIWLCVLLVLSYILFGAFLFSGWEKWDFLDSAYFCFVTLTTIGFGDFVPAQRVHNDSSQVSIALCSLYLLFGISLLAMSFNLVQEEVISNVKLVATRLGIIRDEED